MEYSPPKANIEFVENMSTKWPELKKALDINVELYKGVIPHGVMADYAQIIWDTYEQSGCTELVKEVLSFIDSAYNDATNSNNSDLESLLLASFIYNISSAEHKGTSITTCMNSRLAEVASKYL